MGEKDKRRHDLDRPIEITGKGSEDIGIVGRSLIREAFNSREPYARRKFKEPGEPKRRTVLLGKTVENMLDNLKPEEERRLSEHGIVGREERRKVLAADLLGYHLGMGHEVDTSGFDVEELYAVPGPEELKRRYLERKQNEPNTDKPARVERGKPKTNRGGRK